MNTPMIKRTRLIRLHSATAMVCNLGLAAISTSWPVSMAAPPEHERPDARVQHVLLISVDGFHQSDLAWYVQMHPNSTLANLTTKGIDYSDASTPFPSDSFPGMLALATGGTPSSTGVYYDDTWNHAIFP